MKWWELMQMLSLRDAEEVDLDEGAEGEVADPAEDPQEGGLDQGGEEQVERGVPEDALPEFLRGKSPEEVRAAISQAFQGSQLANQELNQIKRKLAELEGSAKKEPEEPKEPEKPLDELLYEDPEAAIDQVIRKRYGSRFAGLEEQVGSTVFATVRSELPQFDEFEDDIRTLLKDSGAPATRANIIGAYKMALGDRALQEMHQKNRKAANPEKPKAKPPKPKGPQLSDLEREIAAGMGMSAEDYANARDNEDFKVKVPT